MNEKAENTSLIGGLTLFFGIFLLCTDVFFLITGIAYDMPLMRYVIYVKLALNTSNIFLILKKHYLISTVIIYTVILGFMIVGVICIGLVGEFQLYALGMLACISYNGYLHKRILGKELPLAFIIALHVLGYVGVYIYARMTEPLYSIPESGENLFIIFNSVATFGIVIIYVCLFHNVAIRSEEKLEATAMIDNLTGLYNRRGYELNFKRYYKDCLESDSCLAVFVLDMDNLKYVNDNYGHEEGDYCLRTIGDAMKEAAQNDEICIRSGGDEFVILAKNYDDKKAEKLCTTIKESIKNKCINDKKPFIVSVSIGCHLQVPPKVTEDGMNTMLEAFLKKADALMYVEKKEHKKDNKS